MSMVSLRCILPIHFCGWPVTWTRAHIRTHTPTSPPHLPSPTKRPPTHTLTHAAISDQSMKGWRACGAASAEQGWVCADPLAVAVALQPNIVSASKQVCVWVCGCVRARARARAVGEWYHSVLCSFAASSCITVQVYAMPGRSQCSALTHDVAVHTEGSMFELKKTIR